MMFGISSMELKLLMWGIIFGVANWFIMAGARDWFVINFPNISTVLVGFLVIIGILVLFKYRGAIPFKI